jgi:hypothetical protein
LLATNRRGDADSRVVVISESDEATDDAHDLEMFGILVPGRLSADFVGGGGTRTDFEKDRHELGRAAVAVITEPTAWTLGELVADSFNLSDGSTFVMLLPGGGAFRFLVDSLVGTTIFGSDDEGRRGPLSSSFGTVVLPFLILAGGFTSMLVESFIGGDLGGISRLFKFSTKANVLGEFLVRL